MRFRAKSAMKSALLGCLCVCILLVVVSCSSNAGDDTAWAGGVIDMGQATVRAVDAVQPDGLTSTEDVRRQSDFDVNAYLDVLTHLSVEPGYVLDWLYTDTWMGCYPIIYARRAEEPAYASVEDFVEGMRVASSVFAPGMGVASLEDDISQHRDDYLAHVQVDGTSEGYFQLALLRIMGDQFYLTWHAQYNDTYIVCNRETLDRILPETQPELPKWPVDTGEPDEIPDLPPRDLHKEAADIDPRPTVEFAADGIVVVRLVAFSRWGGLQELRFTVSREFPHNLVDSSMESLVPYNCGIVF